MTAIITVTDVEVGKVDVAVNVVAPDILNNTPCELSRLVAWAMLYAAEKWLVNSPVRTIGYSSMTEPGLVPRIPVLQRANAGKAQPTSHGPEEPQHKKDAENDA